MAEVNDKFIIEIGEKYKTAGVVCGTEAGYSPLILYRIKGFNSLVFDDFGLKKLEKYEGDVNEQLLKSATDAAYERGWNDCTSKELSEDANAYERGYNAGLLVSKAQSYEEGLKEGLEKGREEGWEFAKEVSVLAASVKKEIFGAGDGNTINMGYNYLEAKEAVEAYKKTHFCVGDVVEYNDGSRGVIVKATQIDRNCVLYHVLWSDGSTGDYYSDDEISLTNRRLDLSELFGLLEANDERN